MSARTLYVLGWACIALALILALAGCDNATSGRVVNKAYEEPYTYWETDCAAWISNKYGMSCMFYVTNPIAVPECYRLGFHNDQDDEDGSVCLTKDAWSGYDEGDHYGTEKP